MNGNGERTPNTTKPVVQTPGRNFKLLVDPMLTGKKEPKVYRYEGVVQGDTTNPPVVLRDPRNRLTALSKRLESFDLPVPR